VGFFCSFSPKIIAFWFQISSISTPILSSLSIYNIIDPMHVEISLKGLSILLLLWVLIPLNAVT
jgi:uncharacterized membrane protein YhdT